MNYKRIIINSEFGFFWKKLWYISSYKVDYGIFCGMTSGLTVNGWNADSYARGKYRHNPNEYLPELEEFIVKITILTVILLPP
jgi:hypothetical protein